MERTDRRIHWKKEKAQSMVEFALTLPLLLVLFFGIIEFGRLLFVYSSVITASREAARYGSAAGDTGGGTLRFMDCAGMTAAADRVGILANITSVNIHYDSGPGTAAVYTSCPPGAIEGGKHRVVVEVIANYQPIVPLVNIGTLTLESQSARTIFNKIEIGQVPPNPTHLAGLTGSSSPDSNKWRADVSILILDEEGAPVDGATVTGLWSWGNPSTVSCVTNSAGVCTFSRTGIPNGQSSMTFSVADIIHVEKTYDPTANTVGSSITLSKP
jgi:Flp pilus assembly protein TadG